MSVGAALQPNAACSFFFLGLHSKMKVKLATNVTLIRVHPRKDESKVK